MTITDWLNSFVNIVVGLFFGMATHGLATLVGGGNWVLAILIVLPFALLLIVVKVFDRLIDWTFPSSIRLARKQGKPVVRTLSLPLGFALGVLAAAIELSKAIVGTG